MNEPAKSAPRSSVLIVGVGAWNGLGAALARRFARGGHAVAIAGRNAEKLQATAAKLKETGATVGLGIGDAAQAADAQRFVAEAERLAPLGVAIHNAGGNEPGPFLQVTEGG